MQYRVTAPVGGFSGTSVGIPFVDGVATVDGDAVAALAYFRRHGYQVEPVTPSEDPAVAKTTRKR